MFFNQHKVGVGVILKNEKRDTVMAGSKVEIEVADPGSFELLAIFRGMQLCVNMSISDIILESDCLLMVRELQDAKDSFSMLGKLLKKK